jgi:hypothetical protein
VFVRRLKEQEGKDICVMGGGLLAKSLFEADLIDEIGFNIHPVLLGSGIPLFHEMNHQINLELIECKQFKNGCLMVSYRVKRGDVGEGTKRTKSRPARKKQIYDSLCLLRVLCVSVVKLWPIVYPPQRHRAHRFHREKNSRRY